MCLQNLQSIKPLTKKEINAFITNLCNGKHIPQKQRMFLERALKINLEQGIYFSYLDFPEFTPENFRQYIRKLKNYISIGIKSKPCFYRIRGTPERTVAPSITDMPTGGKMLKILENLCEQPASIHDLKITLWSDNLHDLLLKQGHIPNSNNKGILLRSIKFDTNTYSTIQVYSHTILLDIACTHYPIVYDISGVIRLLFILGQIYYHLLLLSNKQANFSPIGDWVVKMYHLGKDGNRGFTNDHFEMTLGDFTNGTIRYYNKLGKDDKRKGRFEQIVSPDAKLIQEIDAMITKSLTNYSS